MISLLAVPRVDSALWVWRVCARGKSFKNINSAVPLNLPKRRKVGNERCIEMY